MNREIEFRGLRVSDKKWIEGDLLHDHWLHGDKFLKKSIRYLINGIYSFPIEVIPESVGQFTGKKDCYDKKVFTGDLISDRPNGKYICEVIFDNDLLSFATRNIKTGGIIYLNNFTYAYIVGNIHEHPHLLTQQK
jgi:hypothetical protein